MRSVGVFDVSRLGHRLGRQGNALLQSAVQGLGQRVGEVCDRGGTCLEMGSQSNAVAFVFRGFSLCHTKVVLLGAFFGTRGLLRDKADAIDLDDQDVADAANLFRLDELNHALPMGV